MPELVRSCPKEICALASHWRHLQQRESRPNRRPSREASAACERRIEAQQKLLTVPSKCRKRLRGLLWNWQTWRAERFYTESLAHQRQCFEKNSKVISPRVQNSKRKMEFLNSALMACHRREIESSLPRCRGEKWGKEDNNHLAIRGKRAVHKSRNAILSVGGNLQADPGDNRDFRILGSPKRVLTLCNT